MNNKLKNLVVVAVLGLLVLAVVLVAFAALRNSKIKKTDDLSTSEPIVSVTRNVVSSNQDENLSKIVVYGGTFKSFRDNTFIIVSNGSEIEVPLPEEVNLICLNADLNQVTFSDEPQVLKQEPLTTRDLGERLTEGDYIQVSNNPEGKESFDPSEFSIIVNESVCN